MIGTIPRGIHSSNTRPYTQKGPHDKGCAILSNPFHFYKGRATLQNIQLQIALQHDKYQHATSYVHTLQFKHKQRSTKQTT